MRFAPTALLVLLAAAPGVAPALAQQISPMTGTTATVPSVSPGPAAAAPATTGTRPATPAATRPRHQGRRTMQQRFDAANTTHDGKLTLDQARAANMTRVVQHYDAMDTARKGYVTMDDIHAFNRSQRLARKAAAKTQ